MLTKILSVWSPLTSIVKRSKIEQAKAMLILYIEDIGFFNPNSFCNRRTERQMLMQHTLSQADGRAEVTMYNPRWIRIEKIEVPMHASHKKSLIIIIITTLTTTDEEAE